MNECVYVCALGNLQAGGRRTASSAQSKTTSFPVHPLELMEKLECDFSFPADHSMELRRKLKWFLCFPAPFPGFVSSSEVMFFDILTSYPILCKLPCTLSRPILLLLRHPSALSLFFLFLHWFSPLVRAQPLRFQLPVTNKQIQGAV